MSDLSLGFYTPPKGRKVFLTSDPHAFHRNLAAGTSSWSDKSGCRDFPDQFVMTKRIADDWNKTVGYDDILICIGDWAFGHPNNVLKFREMVNVKEIVFVLGNHDENIIEHPENQELFAKVTWYNEFRVGKTLITQHHYPYASWHKVGKGSIATHGHCHSSLNAWVQAKMPQSRLIDVGVDNAYKLFGEYRPFSLVDDIIPMMSKKGGFFNDHHRPDMG